MKSFYSLFYNEPIGKKVIRVCTDPACGIKGSDDILRKLYKQYDVEPHQINAKLNLTIEPSPCLGMCELAPAVWIMDGGQWTVNDGQDRPPSMVYGQLRELTRNCGKGETTYLDKYGKYEAFEKARQMPSDKIIAEVKESGLVGRGGAAFPTGVKWEGAAKAESNQKYIICNADESEPGTFKDRILLLDDPHLTIEGMCIGAYAIGASKGFIYVRGEYPYIVPVLEKALNEARDA
ncbi:MAG: NAD(P)H-dependent oxidoreductase subunit E, partial [Anaerolineales bacterium]